MTYHAEPFTWTLVAERGGSLILSGSVTARSYPLAVSRFRERWNLGSDVDVRAIGRLASCCA